jgi:hypothetical protein
MRLAAPLLAALLLGACTKAAPSPEEDLRKQLGIPKAARTVVVFAQTSHLDPGWQKTFDQYYDLYVRDIFLEARAILEAQPRAFYSVAEMAFLKHHVEANPDELPPLRATAARGALRVVGGGMTSPDTVLPETELLLRDFLYGTRFAEQALGARPRAAWLPDSFGHAATAPDVLAAAGFESVAFARIDGAPDIYEMLQHRALRAGSTAERLQQLGSADFRWRSPGGGEVLGHLLTRSLYCTGDDLDYAEPVTLPGIHLGTYHGDDPDYTDRMIDTYVAALHPMARTPYLFVPVGCDFQHPKPKLLEYLDGYNRRRYPATGVWAVAAPFDDYARLVLTHKADLPVIDGDLTPYFMGFYATRPELKRRIREAARPFFAAETFAVAAGDEGLSALAAAAPALEKLTRANHHDFVPGTSTDDVTANEQLPLCDEAEAAGRAALEAVASALARRIPRPSEAIGRLLVLNPAGTARTEMVEARVPLLRPLTGGAVRAATGTRSVPAETLGCEPSSCDQAVRVRLAVEGMPPFSWRAVDLFPGGSPPAARVTLDLLDAGGQPATGDAVARAVLANERVRAVFERRPSFLLVSLQMDGVEALGAPSLGETVYHDMGGLWRLGHEMPGCTFTALAPEASPPETIEVVARSPFRVHLAFRGLDAVHEARLDAGSGGLTLAVTSAAAPDTTRTVSFSFAVAPGAPLRTSIPGGFADRPPEKLFTPTFWPAVGWVTSGEWAILLRQATGARLGPSGEVELLTVRNVPRGEQCDFEGGVGTDPGAHRIEWRIERAASPAAAERAAQAYNRPLELFSPGTAAAPAPDLAVEQSLAEADGDGAVTAIKPAERGEGVILRALLLPGPLQVRLSPPLAGRTAILTDAVERDLTNLGMATNPLSLDRGRTGSIATVRLR